MRILICEDDNDIAELMRIILENAGHQTEVLKECLPYQKIIEWQPNLLLLDIWMSNIDSRNIARQIKNHPRTSHFPIIIISASNNIREVSKEVKADDYLIKPFNIDDLLELVEKYSPPTKSKTI